MSCRLVTCYKCLGLPLHHEAAVRICKQKGVAMFQQNSHERGYLDPPVSQDGFNHRLRILLLSGEALPHIHFVFLYPDSFP